MAKPRGLLIDIDGVLAMSWQALRGAPGALARLRDFGVPYRLVTNTTSRTRASIAEALSASRLPVDVGEILSAPAATAAYLRTTYPGGRCLLLSSGSVVEDLEGVATITMAPDGTIAGTAGRRATPTGLAAVVIGGAGPEFTYEAVCALFQLVLDGVPLVAMHRNRSWKTSDGIQLDSGAYLTAIEEATGVRATVIGKPDPAFFEAALNELGMEAGEVAMVGDDINVDVLGAQAVGMTGVLVRTGKFRPERLERSERKPDAVLDSFADVPTWLGVP